jgi:isopenicillin N synthase-like dioxygenase
MLMVDALPTVELGHADAADQLDAACRSHGFFALVGHDVPQTVIDEAWRTSRAFFALPLAQRMEVAMPAAGYPYGYSPLAAETLAASRGDDGPADHKESFAIGPVDPPGHAFADRDEEFAWSPSLWPSSLPTLRPAWERYYREMADLAGRVLSLTATALGVRADWFEPLISRHTSAMRALHYPGGTDGATGGLGAGAHTDYGTLTILLADPEQPGLQIHSPDAGWVDVPSTPGAFVVNLGDAMARWSNDRWRSTLHRVTVPPADRYSIAFFHNANWDAVIECLPGCCPEGEAPRYPPMAAGPHLMHKFRATQGVTDVA